MVCVFCEMIKGNIEIDKIYEDEKVLAFHDIDPQAPVHILIIPKKHISSLIEIDESDKDLIGHIYIIAKKLMKKFGFEASGYRIVTNVGTNGGQTVGHLHFHAMAGRRFAWPAG